MVTGESMPAAKKSGNKLIGGTVNGTGSLIMTKPGGVIAVADPIKATAQAALETLRNNGLRIVMLTGDNKMTAEAVARKLGIKEIEAEFCRRTRTALSRNSRPRVASLQWRATE